VKFTYLLEIKYSVATILEMMAKVVCQWYAIATQKVGWEEYIWNDLYCVDSNGIWTL